MLFLWFLCATAVSQVSGYGPLLNTVFEWKYVDYLFENDSQRVNAIRSGEYNRSKPVILDADIHRDNRVFVTTLRDNGVPSSLNVVTRKFGRGGPLLAPYPDWSWTKKGDCDGITNVYRIAIDECDRLWVLDTGVFGSDRICPAQLLAFDLNTDTLVTRVKIPDNVAQNCQGKGLLVTPVVHTTNQCQKTYVYMADVEGYGLVVYDGEHVWRLESPYFRNNPRLTNYTIQGESFQLEDGIVGLALSPKTSIKRLLYFKSLSGQDLHSVNIKELTYENRNNRIGYRRYRNFTPSQSAPLAITSDGILFYGPVKQSALVCWNYIRPPMWYNEAVVARSPRLLPFVSGLKVISKITNGYEEELWVVAPQFGKAVNDHLDLNVVNFRIMRGTIMSLTAGTICQPQSMGNNYGALERIADPSEGNTESEH